LFFIVNDCGFYDLTIIELLAVCIALPGIKIQFLNLYIVVQNEMAGR
jgi:hypothetical protein